MLKQILHYLHNFQDKFAKVDVLKSYKGDYYATIYSPSISMNYTLTYILLIIPILLLAIKIVVIFYWAMLPENYSFSILEQLTCAYYYHYEN